MFTKINLCWDENDLVGNLWEDILGGASRRKKVTWNYIPILEKLWPLLSIVSTFILSDLLTTKVVSIFCTIFCSILCFYPNFSFNFVLIFFYILFSFPLSASSRCSTHKHTKLCELLCIDNLFKIVVISENWWISRIANE